MTETLKEAKRSRVRKEADGVAIPSLASGLTAQNVVLSRKLYGENRFSRSHRKGFFRSFLSNLNDPIIKILIAALAVNLVFSFRNANPAESVGIALTVLVSALVTTISEHSSGKTFEKLYATLGDTDVRVIRDGEERAAPTSELVRYDLVLLAPGDTVPADGILLRGSLSCDEAALTGESRAVKKEPSGAVLSALRREGDRFTLPHSPAALFRGSHVVSGGGMMLVTAVGDRTEYGAIAEELSRDDTASPLKERLSALAKTIAKIGYCSASLVAAVSLADAFWFDAGQNPTVALARLTDPSFVASELLNAVTLAVSVIVVAVPEGLPMMITVVLSSNMKRLLNSGVLVRRLVGIETSGAIDILFTDKTGTLTTGKLTVTSFVTTDGEYPNGRALPPILREEMKVSASATSAVFNQTERAVNAFVGVKVRPTEEAGENTVPFDSARKYAAGKIGDTVYLRGAAEYLLPSCKRALSADGTLRPFTDRDRLAVEEKISAYSSSACRVLLECRADGDAFDALRDGNVRDLSLLFVGFYVIRDEIRREVPDAVRSCEKAGIRVVMLTGDNSETAAAIAETCGILPPSHRILRGKDDTESLSSSSPLVLDGAVLRELDDATVSSLFDRIRVISRVTPSDKSRLVKLAKENGHTAGMTGDGVNDAPALKVADVGFAMGSGTDIAREAGDIVITDDNFVSITHAVRYGRTIFSSIRKFITFQLTMNLAAVGVSVIAPMFGVESPVTVIQMLWVNLIMDTLGSLAFAGEPALSRIMTEQPLNRREPILTGAILRQMLFTGGYAIAVSLSFLLSPSVRHFFGGSEVAHLTRFFALFIFMGIFIAFCTRTPRLFLFADITKNGAFLLIMPSVAFVQLLILYFGGEMFRCVPLSPKELWYSALFAFTVVPADLIRKCVVRLVHSRKTSVR